MDHPISSIHQSALTLAIRILKEAGTKEIYLFGSVADGTSDEFSDLDIAVRGLSDGKFFTVYGRLLMELPVSVDLLTLDKGGDFAEFLQKNGDLKRVA